MEASVADIVSVCVVDGLKVVQVGNDDRVRDLGFIEASHLKAAINAEEDRHGMDPMNMMTLRDVHLVINRLDGIGGQKDGVLELREFVAGMKDLLSITTEAIMNRFFELRDEAKAEVRAADLASQLRRQQSFHLHHDPFGSKVDQSPVMRTGGS